MEEQPSVSTQEQEIDLIELAQKIWKERKFVLKACCLGAVVGLVIAFSIPKEYKTEVKLSPENAQGNKVNQLGGLAAMAGVNLGGTTGTDALTVDLYPDIVMSTPFLLELVATPVTTKKGNLEVPFYEYMTDHQKSAWWICVKSLPFNALGWVMSLFKEKEQGDNCVINPFQLTNEQEQFIINIKARIEVKIDRKNGAIAVSVMMQDPLISARIADIVLTKLQEYITDYRTRKAKNDLMFSEKLFLEAKGSYYNVQKSYAIYVDANKNVISESFKTEEERLRNEMNLAYGVYEQMAQQLEANKIKVQEQTPVYAVIEPARVPVKASEPNKILIFMGIVSFFCLVSVIWLFFRNYLVQKQK